MLPRKSQLPIIMHTDGCADGNAWKSQNITFNFRGPCVNIEVCPTRLFGFWSDGMTAADACTFTFTFRLVEKI